MPDYRPGPTPTTYELGLKQTPTGARACVTLHMAAGGALPTHVFLADGSFVVPDADGTIVVPATAVRELRTTGWTQVASSDPPAVTVP